jgi:Flp pilus assembly protein TadB
MTVILSLLAILMLAAALMPQRPRVGTLFARDRSERVTRTALPALIDALASALGSGLSLSLAFAEIAPTTDAALAAPTRRVAADLALGTHISDALGAYAGVLPPQDITPLSVVLRSFIRSGGRVGPSLERMSALLRGRLALEDERRALTAQSRASATVLIALAPLGALFFAFAMPDYVGVLVSEGRALLALGLAFEAAGAAWLWRIVRSTAAIDDLAILLDAVVVGLDAGLTFEAALRAFVERAPAVPGTQRARRLLADVSLGVPLVDALSAFASKPEEVRVAALVGSSARFGSPLAHLLVLQADAIREAERHEAEARARRLPVLMLFPLSMCILPALLIVFLGPPLMTLLR